MPTPPFSFAICILCFADVLGAPAAFTAHRYHLHNVIWIQESPVTAHRLLQEDDHTILTGCGRRYSTGSPSLLAAGAPGPA